MKHLAIEIPHMVDSDVWCQNNALSSMQIKHFNYSEYPFFPYSVSKQNIKRNFKCIVLSASDSNSQGEPSHLFSCWKGGDPKWKS